MVRLWFVRLLAGAMALYALAWGYRITSRKYYVWLPGYLRWAASRAERPHEPVHIIFFYSDHFEPGLNVEWTERWEREYPPLADRHRDNSGRPVQHTWFYHGEVQLDENMEILTRLVHGGYGEVELHLHHGPDTLESARHKFQQAIQYFQRYGFLKSVDGQTHFGFVHGMNALDNGLGGRYCGVNTELRLLRELGCYADFTFPTLWAEAQPSMINQIYAVTDDRREKSYDRGLPLRVARPVDGDLVIFPGPAVLAPALDPRRLFFVLENGDVHAGVPLTERRVDLWVRANVHVEGRPEWVFIKVAGHGAASQVEMDETLGADFDRALSYLERRYNDGRHYALHYVTAREAYNIARAAAAGGSGNPDHYRNWMIPPYQAGAAQSDSDAELITSSGPATP